MDGITTFFEEWFKKLILGLYNGVVDTLDSWLIIYNDASNGAITKAYNLIALGKDANGFHEANKYIKIISDNVFIPFAAITISFFFCWQLINLMQENNRLNTITPETMLFVLIKLCICPLVVSKSWDIVQGFFSISDWASSKVYFVFSSSDLSSLSITAADLGLGPADETTEIGVLVKGIFSGILAFVLLEISSVAVYALGFYIRIKVYMWIFEFLMFAAGSPIPFSTFINKEWGQMGNNYLRKMLALSFTGVFMLLAVTIASVIGNGLIADSAGSIMGILAGVLSLGLSAMMIGKCNSVADSIFNAH